MHPFFAECAKKAPALAISARNACFSRSRWQDPRLMRPFPGAIGRFGMHGARILPPRALFRVEEPEITHDAKMLPALPDLSRHRGAGHGPANWPNGLCALRPGPGPLAVSRVSAIRPRAPRLHACQAAATRRATHRRHSHACTAPQRCRYSRGRIHRRRPSRRARRAHYAASPATSPVTLFIAVGGVSRRSGARAAPSSFAPAPTTCASRCPLQPRATRVPCPSRTSRGLRRIQQTSGTARATQCGHKNRIPERGSH